MTSTTLLTAEQYLTAHLSDEWPPEYVRGELVERSMPKWLHGRLQSLLTVRLEQAGLLCATELHIRVAEDIIRIADLAAYRNAPNEEIPATPALLLVEIVSPKDPHQELMRKLAEYEAWGVPHIWVVSPAIGKFHVYHDGSLKEVSQFELGEFGVRITPEELLARVNGR